MQNLAEQVYRHIWQKWNEINSQYDLFAPIKTIDCPADYLMAIGVKCQYEKGKTKIGDMSLLISQPVLWKETLFNSNNIENYKEYLDLVLRHEMGHLIQLHTYPTRFPTSKEMGRYRRHNTIQEKKFWKWHEEFWKKLSRADLSFHYHSTIDVEREANEMVGIIPEDFRSIYRKIRGTAIYKYERSIYCYDYSFDTPEGDTEIQFKMESGG